MPAVWSLRDIHTFAVSWEATLSVAPPVLPRAFLEVQEDGAMTTGNVSVINGCKSVFAFA